MDNKTEYDKNLEAIQAVPNDDVKTPPIPVDVIIDEALDLSVTATEDREALVAVGMPETLISDLKSMPLALRYSEMVWTESKDKLEANGKDWNQKKEPAMTLKEKLIHDYRFAYRKMPDIMSKIREIDEGSGYPDMVQDLGELYMLGTKNPAPLQAINYNMEKLNEANSLSVEMGNLLALVNGERNHDAEEKNLRDRAYTILAEVVSEVRAYGKYVFVNNEKRYKLYTSDYLRKHRTKKDSEESTETENE